MCVFVHVSKSVDIHVYVRNGECKGMPPDVTAETDFPYPTTRG